MQSFALNFSSMQSVDFKNQRKKVVCNLQHPPLVYPPMSVELKNARADRHPLKMTRIIPTPLALQEEAFKQIENLSLIHI